MTLKNYSIKNSIKIDLIKQTSFLVFRVIAISIQTVFW